ncbi:MAG: LysR substrate-binding domain-containing protein, partial [Gammaproteobacteria bacterium]|nr:LysR substrate-binding domain-containing protein [Gammaproteobacteria bacterium]
FDRIGRQVLLTEAGVQFLPKCQQILDSVDDALTTLNNLSGNVQGSLRIGTSHHIGLHRLPPYLRQFSRDYPKVSLNIQFLTSEEICNLVEHGALELGIITLPNALPDNLISKTLWTDELRFFAANSHPLAQQKNIDLKELANYEALLPEENTYTRDIIESVFEKNKLALNTKLSTNFLETLKMLTSVGLGWSVLPLSMQDKDIVEIKVKKVKLKRQLGFIQHKQRTLSNAAIAMSSLLVTAKD